MLYTCTVVPKVMIDPLKVAILFERSKKFLSHKKIQKPWEGLYKLGILSQVRPLLTTESTICLYKSMILLLLEFCDATLHGCCYENHMKIERLQRRAGKPHADEMLGAYLQWTSIPTWRRRSAPSRFMLQKPG